MKNESIEDAIRESKEMLEKHKDNCELKPWLDILANQVKTMEYIKRVQKGVEKQIIGRA
jgi:hypothetical protein